MSCEAQDKGESTFIIDGPSLDQHNWWCVRAIFYGQCQLGPSYEQLPLNPFERANPWGWVTRISKVSSYILFGFLINHNILLSTLEWIKLHVKLIKSKAQSCDWYSLGESDLSVSLVILLLSLGWFTFRKVATIRLCNYCKWSII